ncbi:uncharacterized protein LOC126565750 [Anopheles maculipalpis]|uniref:uncharacterized protein LOC126565750 n=1 Tax=Anopheles maculipalpis TaxID=1496333 RepID=UPI002159902A|nr:uncharacterized protein LOC126565750 [Anopheles maculipalpis]
MYVWEHYILLCMAAACVQPIFSIKVSFERFEQYFGDEYMHFDLRVRKYNRTEMTLNGTIFVNQPVDDTIMFASDIFLSRLGNQQFQHYPLHLPTSGLCEFKNHLHEEYPSTIAGIANMPKIGECPFTPRAMHIQDKTFPTEVLPDSLSNGLWKLVISGILDEKIVLRYMISVRLNDDYLSF